MSETPRIPINPDSRKTIDDKDLENASGGFMKKELWITTPQKPQGSASATEQTDTGLGGTPAGT